MAVRCQCSPCWASGEANLGINTFLTLWVVLLHFYCFSLRNCLVGLICHQRWDSRQRPITVIACRGRQTKYPEHGKATDNFFSFFFFNKNEIAVVIDPITIWLSVQIWLKFKVGIRNMFFLFSSTSCKKNSNNYCRRSTRQLWFTKNSVQHKGWIKKYY